MKKSFLAACLLSITTAIPHQIRNEACTITHQPGFNSNPATHQLISGNLTRTYAVNVPESYNDNLGKAWPMIIDYHGNLGNPEDQYRNSEYYKYPQGQEYLVIYPLGVEKHWQGPTYALPTVNDLLFTVDLLTHLQSTYCIDPLRIYASGKSNGAGFVNLLACSPQGDFFAAFAMAAAALYTDTSLTSCMPTTNKRRKILEAHGLQDATIPYHPTAPGSGGPLPDIGEWVGWWGGEELWEKY
ncbi:uncharacterized protein RCC_06927 [Ramularia collo-cygni]|uniref:feruloyl esterase n=1 Tax=Ramularia collo-cygni TaxID=112498 RepID=A0A2D3VBK1_9PEZI|nr:uncharacterized protein RCC_06927 [Ramularia collo-cygni]CZT21066.1 uncharacterized protein RCC_06927 [Ramularia collo-cygni]